MSELHIETLSRREASGWDALAGEGADPWSDDPPDPMRRLIAWRAGAPAGRLAFGTVGEMGSVAGRAGVVGWYEAADQDAGVALLRRARRNLGMVGAEEVIGPLDWSIWRRYRVVLRAGDPDEPPPFLTEPWNPPSYPTHFEAAGFEPAAEYESRIVPPSPEDGIRALQARNRLRERGIELRPLEAVLSPRTEERLHELATKAFADRRFYSDLPLERFRRSFDRLRPHLDARFAQVAVGRAGEPLGFVLAFVDPLAPRGSVRVVLGSLVVDPQHEAEGIDTALAALVHGEASSRGAPVIHALLESDSATLAPAARERPGRPFRRYRLYRAAAGD